MKSYHSVIALMLLLLFSGVAEAKWWIFGSSQAEVSTRYIYLNDLSYDELGDQVTLYAETLPQGEVIIRGQGSAGKNRIGAVQISLDGQQSWDKAQVTADGSFLYRFVPETGKQYDLFVKVIDTTGKSNDVEASRKLLTVSVDSIQDKVYETLDQLIRAYQEEDSFAFMRLVSDSFANGADVLDSAIRQDFSLFDNITLNYTLNNITSARNGNLFVALSFSRMLTSSRSGETFTDQAQTEFIFSVENGIPKIYSMKNPLIFGLSDAAEVASGSVNGQQDVEVIAVADNGTVSLKKLSDLGTDGSGSSAGGEESVVLFSETTHQGLIMSSGTVAVESGGNTDFYLETNILYSDNGSQCQLLGTMPLSAVTSVPTSGYGPINMIHFNIGQTYAVLLPSGHYGVFHIDNFIEQAGPKGTLYLTYKYQADGTPNF